MPAFTVGFVLTPLASNASELVSSLKFAARKRITNMSLTLAQGEPSCACNCARPRTLAGLEAGARGGSGWATQACTGGYGQPALDAPTATHTTGMPRAVYGAVTLNNTLVLGIFLYVVYLRQLPWVYSSEVTVIVASSLIMGALGYSRSTFQVCPCIHTQRPAPHTHSRGMQTAYKLAPGALADVQSTGLAPLPTAPPTAACRQSGRCLQLRCTRFRC